MSSATRISAEAARTHVDRSDPLIVCAYEDEAKCRKYALAGSISYTALRGRLDEIEKDRELILYCA